MVHPGMYTLYHPGMYTLYHPGIYTLYHSGYTPARYMQCCPTPRVHAGQRCPVEEALGSTLGLIRKRRGMRRRELSNV